MFRLIINICAKAALIMGIVMLLPMICDLYVGNTDWIIFIRACALTIMLSFLLLFATRGEKWRFSARFGFCLTLYLWFLAILLGALPFYFSHLHLSFAQSVFEATSDITATGATVLEGLDHLPPGILLWRSLLCWLGGLGVMALTLFLLPNLRNDGVQFFNMEASYKSEKLFPRVNQVISRIIIIYLGLSFFCMLSYFLAGMSLFDAINHSMTTMATSGVSTHDNSFAYFNSGYIIVIGGIFMILGSLPITFYLKVFAVGLRKSLRDIQVVTFLAIILICVAILSYYLKTRLNLPLEQALLAGYFQFISLVSTSGYTSCDYSNWGSFAISMLLVATIIGGCSGSTSGGIKINRLVMLFKITGCYLNKLIFPHMMIKSRYAESEITEEVAQSVLLFICLYLITIIVGMQALMMVGLDLVSAFSGAIGCLGNMGLGLGDKIGPMGNYSLLNSDALWIFSFLMLAGRLELITLYVVFVPSFWRK